MVEGESADAMLTGRKEIEMNVSGQRILIPGGSSGDGLETARQLGAKGARLCSRPRAGKLAEVVGN
jgi:NAD(P)-dependent dehydrogenase (short-subunit alcohol dehydrogenase family)